ncbi:hypothetical protein DFH08DRAFT_802300 [Mycena albidolilacea]|uniref:Uncharacterized protein n=1 Tax=Mycena albidolilacea TaxID=1033008 RepID=A0AAD7EYQ3_9AGAR|nr:hypothetical protein DFH08DRAFT_802300 [Mycena albidolilacea]
MPAILYSFFAFTTALVLVSLLQRRELTFWLAKVACARAKWLVQGGGVDLGGITRPRPAEWLASHFVGLASHSAGLASAKIKMWLAHLGRRTSPQWPIYYDR